MIYSQNAFTELLFDIYRLASNFNMNWENIFVEGMINYLDRTIRQTKYTFEVLIATDVRRVHSLMRLACSPNQKIKNGTILPTCNQFRSIQYRRDTITSSHQYLNVRRLISCLLNICSRMKRNNYSRNVANFVNG